MSKNNKTFSEKFEEFKEENRTKMRYLAIGGAVGGLLAIAAIRKLSYQPQINALQADTDALFNNNSLILENQIEIMNVLKSNDLIDDVKIKYI